MTTSSKWLTVNEVAKELRASPRFVADEIRRKRLRATKAACWLVDPADLKVYTDSRANVRPVRKAS
jgi:hypothetical protein